jgi:hypothetical protein
LPPPPALIRGSIDGERAHTHGRSSGNTLRVVFGMEKDVMKVTIQHNDLFYTEEDFASSEKNGLVGVLKYQYGLLLPVLGDREIMASFLLPHDQRRGC